MEVLSILEPWLYGGDPAQNLSYRQVLAALEEKMHSGYLEALLRRMLLEEADGFLAILVPDTQLGQQRVEQERQRVSDYWDSLNDTQRQQLPRQLEAFHQWQQTPDSQQALASIPVLSLEDIQQELPPLPCRESRVEGIPVLLQETGNDLVYLNLYFNASDALPEDMPLLNLLGELLGTLATENRTATQLQTAIRQCAGRLSFGTSVFHRNTESHRTVFSAHLVCLAAYR